MKVEGFSQLTKIEKINLIAENFFKFNKQQALDIKSFWHNDKKTQELFEQFSENTISNYHLPFGVTPNVKINNKVYCVPMVIEESSVVAAASKSAKYWYQRGGFKAEILGTQKVGHVHLDFDGNINTLKECFEDSRQQLLDEVESLQTSMKKRGGGLSSLSFIDLSDKEEGLCQIEGHFETCDAMGANFINTILEAIGHKFKTIVDRKFLGKGHLEIIMCILSNYTPNCLVRVSVTCAISDLDDKNLGMTPELFAQKIYKAVRVSRVDPFRATTHNKGIFNGIDSVVIATGNDFRATAACGHAYACRDGQYKGLTDCKLEEGLFSMWIDIPLALGTIGGLTSLHPMAKFSLDLLGRPNAQELMMIVATIGLAQNFAALKSLVTSGIQKGHMKMHLMNILNHLEANKKESALAKEYFLGKAVSYSCVREYLGIIRNYQ